MQPLPDETAPSKRRDSHPTDIDITEAGQGRFRAVCRSTGLEIISANAEHDLCHLLTDAGYPDGPVQFWRGSTPLLSHPSIHRIALGDDCPQRVKRKDTRPEILSEALEGSSLEPIGDELATGQPGAGAPVLRLRTGLHVVSIEEART